jgi:hypothetical protein
MYIVTDRRRSVILHIGQHKNATKEKEKGESGRTHWGALFFFIKAGETETFTAVIFPTYYPFFRLVAELSHENRKTERTKLIVAFRNSANAPKVCLFYVFRFMLPYANLIREHQLGYIMKVTPFFFANMSLGTDIRASTVVELLMRFMSSLSVFIWLI